MPQDNGTPPFEIEYDKDSKRYHVEFDPDVVQPSLVVVKAMAEITDKEPVALPPLAESVDIDVGMVDSIVTSGRRHTPTEPASLECMYLQHRVTVHGDGKLEITPL